MSLTSALDILTWNVILIVAYVFFDVLYIQPSRRVESFLNFQWTSDDCDDSDDVLGIGRSQKNINNPCQDQASQVIKKASPVHWLQRCQPQTIIIMEISQTRPSGLLRFLFAFYALALITPANSLYFFLEGGAPKCFYEELPKDTLVVGESTTSLKPLKIQLSNLFPGKYKAEQYDNTLASFKPNPDLSMTVTVDEIFSHDHRVVNTRGSSEGRFTFSAADSGDHRICFTPSHMASGGWLSGGQPVGGIKLSLDLAIGETSAIESKDKGKLSDIVEKVRDLNARLQDIRREQVFQRVRPASLHIIYEAFNF